MSSRNTSVFGIITDKSSLEVAVDALKRAGFSSNDISALMPDDHGTKDLACEKHTKAPEGAVSGGTAGIILGGALGWLVGLGVLAIPGVGPFIAAGPIMAMLAGAGVVGTVGGLSGALIGMGLPEFEAKRYETKLHHGRILLSVHSNNSEEISRAKEILQRVGAEDISTAGEAKVEGVKSDKYTGTTPPRNTNTTYPTGTTSYPNEGMRP